MCLAGLFGAAGLLGTLLGDILAPLIDYPLLACLGLLLGPLTPIWWLAECVVIPFTPAIIFVLDVLVSPLIVGISLLGGLGDLAVGGLGVSSILAGCCGLNTLALGGEGLLTLFELCAGILGAITGVGSIGLGLCRNITQILGAF
jgi:hypothetical protein